MAAKISNGLLTNITVAGGIPTVHYAVSIAGTGIHTCTSCFGIFGSATSALNGSGYNITAVGANTVTLSSTSAGNTTYNDATLTASAWAYTGNIMWDTLNSTTFDGLSNFYYSGDPTAHALLDFPNYFKIESLAIKCYINELDSNSCYGAKWGVNHFEMLATKGTFALMEDVTQKPEDFADQDYGSRIGGEIARSFELLMSTVNHQLSSGERTIFHDKVFNSQIPAGETCTKGSKVNGAGTVAIDNSGNVTGTGTLFTSQVSVGDVLDWPNTLDYAGKCRVDSISSDTIAHCQLSAGPPQGAYTIARPWLTGTCGYQMWAMHHPGGWPGHPRLLPPTGSTISTAYTNQLWSRFGGFYQLGLAICADGDHRGCYAAESYEQFYMDYMMPSEANLMAGTLGFGTNYDYSIGFWSYNLWPIVTKNAVISGPPLFNMDMYKSQGEWMRYTQLPGVPAPSDAGFRFAKTYPVCYGTTCNPQHGYDPRSDVSFGDSLTTYSAINPDSADASKYAYWLHHDMGWWNLTDFDNAAAKGIDFETSTPTIPETNFHSTDPLGKVFRPSDAQFQDCVNQGMQVWQFPCVKGFSYNHAVSKTGWDLTSSSQDTFLFMYGAAYTAERSPARYGEYFLWKGDELIGADDPNRSGRVAIDYNTQYSQWQLTRTANQVNINAYASMGFDHGAIKINTGYGSPHQPTFDRFSTSDTAGHQFTYAHLDCATCFRPSMGVQKWSREWLDDKTGNQYVFSYTYGDLTGSPTSIFGDFVHYQQNGEANEGTTTCVGSGGCGSFSTNGSEILSLSPRSGVHSKFLPVGGTSWPFLEYLSDYTLQTQVDNGVAVSSRDFWVNYPMSVTGFLGAAPIVRLGHGRSTANISQTAGLRGGATAQWYYSQATKIAGTLSDLSATGAYSGPCVVSSASYSFSGPDVGRAVQITGPPTTDWHMRGYRIVSVAGGNATLDKACSGTPGINVIAASGVWTLWTPESVSVTQDASGTLLRPYVNAATDLSTSNGLGSLVAIDTLAAAITDTTSTIFTVTSGQGIIIGSTIQIDSEKFLVSNNISGTITATRGYLGTTAATHSNGAAVQQLGCTVHSPSRTWLQDDVGGVGGQIYLTGGTNWLSATYYNIIAVSGGDATIVVDKTYAPVCGTANSLTSGTFSAFGDVVEVTYNTMASGTLGGGHTTKISACSGTVGTCDPAATKYEMVIVHKPFWGTTDPGITVSQLSPDANWTGVQTEDKVALFARNGSKQLTVTDFTTTHSGTAHYVLTGLVPGSYAITKGGSGVSGSPFTVVDGVNTAEFLSTAGLIHISGTASACTITSSSLPGGTISIAYTQTIGTANCAAPVVWSITAGSICPGLSLAASTGIVSGTPSSATTCSFTAHVVDNVASAASQAFSITIGGSSGGGAAIHHILMDGQSLSQGLNGQYATAGASSGTGPLSVTQPYANLMLGDGCNWDSGLGRCMFQGVSFNPLIESVNPTTGQTGNNAVETLASGMANTLTNLSGGSYVSLVSHHGWTGNVYDALKRIPTAPTLPITGTIYYQSLVDAISTAKADAAALSRPYTVDALVITHGENDLLTGHMPAATYEADLLEWQAAVSFDRNRLNGQSGRVPMFVDQTDFWSVYGIPTPTTDGTLNPASDSTPIGQWHAAMNHPDSVFLTGPKYGGALGSGTSAGLSALYYDNIHLVTAGYRLLGGYHGKALKKVLVDGGRWVPLAPRSIGIAANVITFRMWVPAGNIMIDTTTMPDMTACTMVNDPTAYSTAAACRAVGGTWRPYGLEFYDSTNSAYITSITVSSGDTLTITLNTTPSGSDQRLRAAYSGRLNSNDFTHSYSIGTNIRDTDTTVDASGSHLYDWLISFDEPMGFTWNPNGGSESGTLTVAPTTLAFSCIAGGANPVSQNIAVGETGGTLDQFSANDTQPWLSLSPTAGGAAGNVAVSVTGCAGLAPGTVTDTITVSSTTAGITGSPRTVGVSLVVASPPPTSNLAGNATASGNVVIH
jgi:hypothetical protein